MGSDRPLWRRLVELLAWVALALALRLWVVEPRWIPSGSMLPTLQLQDRILVERCGPAWDNRCPLERWWCFVRPLHWWRLATTLPRP